MEIAKPFESSTIESVPVVEELEKMIIREEGSTVNYPKGNVLFSAGDYADRVYLIESGWVKIYRLSPDGRRVTVGSIRSPGEMMGLAETMLGVERTCFAGAISDVSVITLRKKQFEEMLAKHPLLAIKMSKLLAYRMREAEGIIHEMVCWQTPGRLALTLMKMSERCGKATQNGILLDVQLTHEELASMVGASRQTVTSLLNTFKQERCISYEGRTINILDPDKLAKWIV